MITAKETLDYCIRDLTSPEGGFYSAQDADSEGEEGKFYLWTLQEVLDALQPADAELAVHIYGLKPEGNFSRQQRQKHTSHRRTPRRACDIQRLNIR